MTGSAWFIRSFLQEALLAQGVRETPGNTNADCTFCWR